MACLVVLLILSYGFLFLFWNFTLLSFQVTCPFPLCFSHQSDCLPRPDCFQLFPIFVCIYSLHLPVRLVLCTREPAPCHRLVKNCQHLFHAPVLSGFILFFDTLSSSSFCWWVFPHISVFSFISCCSFLFLLVSDFFSFTLIIKDLFIFHFVSWVVRLGSSPSSVVTYSFITTNM